MDLCLFVEKGDRELSRKAERNFDLDLLYTSRKLMKRNCGKFIGSIELIPAKVPILKFFDKFGKIEVRSLMTIDQYLVGCVRIPCLRLFR